ncbi:MAG: hypothetical protein R2883_08615 [Caldisericia bacterium]
MVVWALFDFPRLDKTQGISEKMVLRSNDCRDNLTISVMIHSSSKSGDVIGIVQVLYAVLTLGIFAAALRCTMVFAGGRIGRPFFFIAIGGLSISLYVYYIWLPYTPNVTAFSLIHTFWVFCFLITALGAFDMTLSDTVNG